MANVITLEGGDVVISASLDGGDIYPSGGGGGGNLQAKSVSYTPTEVSVSDHLTPSAGYDGFSYVDVSIDGISPTYIGSAIPLRNSSDLSAAGAIVTAPYGYYGAAASTTIPNASTPYGGISSIDSSGNVTIDFEIDYGGYIGAGTYTVMDTMSVQGAQTIYPSTSDQSIASGKYLKGAQTIKGVTYSGLDAGNIKKDVVVKIGDSADDDRILSVTGTYEGGGGGISVDEMADGSEPSGDVILNTATSIRERAFNDCTNITSIHAKDVTSLGQYIVNGCTSLTTFVSESQTTGAYNVFSGARQLTAIDFDHKGSPSNNFFQNCASLTTLVLRRTDAITALGSTGAFSGTPFASSGTGGTLYVPNSLLASYQSASNWSTILGYANNQIKSIESTHTDPTAPIDLTLYYADGTAIS